MELPVDFSTTLEVMLRVRSTAHEAKIMAVDGIEVGAGAPVDDDVKSCILGKVRKIVGDVLPAEKEAVFPMMDGTARIKLRLCGREG